MILYTRIEYQLQLRFMLTVGLFVFSCTSACFERYCFLECYFCALALTLCSLNALYHFSLKVKDDPPVKQTISNFSRHSSTWLNRSSGLAVQLKMLRVDFSTTFQEVNYVVNDNGGLPKDPSSRDILRHFCSSPIPDYYIISLQEYRNKVKLIKGHPNLPCPSYDGNPSSIPVNANLLSCNGAENSVVRLFGENSVPEDFWKEEHSTQCHNLKQNCNNCRDMCTELARNNPVCNLTKKDLRRERKQDYGEHFTYCFDCCFQKNCTCSNCACSLYDISCIASQVTCVQAKQYTIPLSPIFPNGRNFKCHVEMSRGPVFEMEASVWKDEKLLKIIETSGSNNSQDVGSGRDYGYMLLKHPSLLRNDITKNIMISGKAGGIRIRCGVVQT